ncbi:MAG TPA: hypothetical protein VKU92_09170 [Acidimicrobiales bacterium]|nr:hypothetical protein [Acidimicrobiales bacterium]
MHLDEPPVRAPGAGTLANVPSSPGEVDAAGRARLGSRNEPGSGSSQRSRLERYVWLGTAVVLAVSVALRFYTRSPLWLDEALTVDIASRPLRELPHLLSHDGAPPLYYVMLHVWMGVFGTGNLATRSLAGVIGVINMPVAWLAGFRVGSRWWSLDEADPGEQAARRARGRVTGWATLLLFATSPFAVYYDTEARMYGLALLLGTLGIIAITQVLRRPRWQPALGVAAVASAALYTHYWALYVCAVVGVGALWCAWRGPHRKAALYVVGSLVVAGISFIPWFPIFYFQLKHTGTPWAQPAGYAVLVHAFTQFAGGNSAPGRALALLFFFLVVLAIFGAASGRYQVQLDLLTRSGVRAILAVVLATLVLAVVGGQLSGSTFVDRYTSFVTVPALIAFAYGVTAIGDRRVQVGVTGLAVVLGLAAAVPNATLLRTQAGQVAHAIEASIRPGDVVAYCPDQLGPSVSRELGDRPLEYTFPRGTPPEIVDWVNYKQVIDAASPLAFAHFVEREAAGHTIWYVSASTYPEFGSDCARIAADLAQYGRRRQIVADTPSDTPFEVYEGMFLTRFTPPA